MLLNTSIFYSIICYALAGTGIIVFTVLFFFTAPYGRYRRGGWGKEISSKLVWIIMEGIAFAGFLVFFIIGDWKREVMAWVFLCLWMTHYIYRTFIFSNLSRSDKTMPLSIMFFAVFFNGINTYVQGRFLFTYAGPAGRYPLEWLGSARFIIGLLVFITGFVIHVRSDQILRNLRQGGETGYKIPGGWLFKWISCPNYFGEMLEWTGWAILTWSFPGLLFALWTFFNLFPRAIAYHKWYRSSFDDYPPERKAVVPFIL